MNTTVENPKDADDAMTEKAYVRDHIGAFAKPDATHDEVDGLDATPSELLAESYQQEALYERAHGDSSE